jgi:DNA-binding MarR family transcriptional regulator
MPGARKVDGRTADEMVTALLGASRVLVGVSARSLADVESDVSVTQFRTLVVLHSHGTINLNRLAELLGVNNSTAVRMIDRLLVAGLVTRQDNPANRREIELDLSPAGRQIVVDVTNRRRAEIALIVARMPVDQRDALVQALHEFADAAGEPAPDPSTLGW